MSKPRPLKAATDQTEPYNSIKMVYFVLPTDMSWGKLRT